jgi:hypothetical protein
MHRLGTLIGKAGKALLVMGLTTLAAASSAAGDSKDPLAAEIERWAAFLRDNTGTGEDWADVKQLSEPPLARAQGALRDGRRLLALLSLAAARENLAAAAYVGERSADERKDASAFEAEWMRMGTILRDDLAPLSPGALDGVRPAAVRALGEAALAQVRVYYDASLEYGRNTMPESGLFYLGSAQAQREFAAFCRTLSAPSPLAAPPVRALDGELDALESEILAAYRPPASIDRHDEFILASSTLKEARDLSAAGLHYGALLRYLQATQRFAPLRPARASLDAAGLAGRLRELGARLSAGSFDHSLGRLFLEVAEADGAGAGRESASAIATDVLPRYFAALEPRHPQPPRPAPGVTVTLVRWPYT